MKKLLFLFFTIFYTITIFSQTGKVLESLEFESQLESIDAEKLK